MMPWVESCDDYPACQFTSNVCALCAPVGFGKGQAMSQTSGVTPALYDNVKKAKPKGKGKK